MKPATAARFDWRVVPPTMTPGPGRGTDASTVRTLTSIPDCRSWTGSLLTKPVAASTAPCASAVACPKSGYSTTVTSDVLRFADASSAWSMTHDDPYLPGIPIFLPRRPAALSAPPSLRVRTTDGNWP